MLTEEWIKQELIDYAKESNFITELEKKNALLVRTKSVNRLQNRSVELY